MARKQSSVLMALGLAVACSAVAETPLDLSHIQLVDEYRVPGLETEISGIYPHPTDDDLYLAVSNGRPVYKPSMTPLLPVELRNKLLIVSKDGSIVEALDLPDGGGLFGGMGIDNEGSVWLGPLDPPEVWKLDLASGEIQMEFALPGPVGGLDYDRENDVVWLTNYIGHPSMLVLDPTSGEILQSLWSNENCQGIAKVGGDWLTFWTSSWEADAFSELWQLDEVTGKPKYRQRVDVVHAAMAPLDPKISGYEGFISLVHLDSGTSGRTAVRKYRYVKESARDGAAQIVPKRSSTSKVAIVSTDDWAPPEAISDGKDVRDDPMMRIRQLVKAASASDADYVLLPEHSFYAEAARGGSIRDVDAVAQPIPGPITRFIGEIAKESSIWVSFSILEKVDRELHVTSVLSDDNGEIVAKYRKRTLTPGGWEAAATPGFARELFDTIARDETRVGIASGNDILTAIPRLASRGANMVFVNASWSETSKVNWPERVQSLSNSHNVAVIVSDLLGKGSGVFLPFSEKASQRPCARCDDIGIKLYEFDIPGHQWRVQRPIGLPEVPIPSDLAFNPAIVELGQSLFFDVGLSQAGDVACASCHKPEMAFSDGQVTGTGTLERRTRRNVPSLLNAAYRGMLNWDGNPTTIEQQIKYPLMGSAEMDIRSEEMLRNRLRAINALEPLQQLHGVDRIGFPEVAKTLGAYIRTLVSAESPFDMYYYAGQSEAMDAEAQQGLALFTSDFDCVSCHTIQSKHALFADDQFHRLGVGFDSNTGYYLDPGVGMVSNRDYDGMFFTPTLRDVDNTAPYMHDGSIPGLANAIRAHYADNGIQKSQSLSRSPPTDEELEYIVAFLKSLTGSSARHGHARIGGDEAETNHSTSVRR